MRAPLISLCGAACVQAFLTTPGSVRPAANSARPRTRPLMWKAQACPQDGGERCSLGAEAKDGGLAGSRRRFTAWAGAAASAALITAATPRRSYAVDAELYKGLRVDDPYLLMEPAGESFRGNKGPNLQLPDELTDEDEEPEALSSRFSSKPSIDLLENLSLTEIVASSLWGSFLYFGIFDINIKSNVVSQASGDAGAVRPSDWVKVKLGSALGESQKTWSEDYAAPLPIEAFTISLFLLFGVAIDRSIVVGAGDVSGYFALSSAVVGCLWAGFYELGRMQQTGYRVTREEQGECIQSAIALCMRDATECTSCANVRAGLRAAVAMRLRLSPAPLTAHGTLLGFHSIHLLFTAHFLCLRFTAHFLCLLLLLTFFACTIKALLISHG
jgi:hypothetical protein